MRSFLIIILFISVLSDSRAQETEKISQPKWAITVRPIGFFDPFLTNFTVGGQYRINDNILSEINVGLIQSWFCTYNQKEDHIEKTGFRFSGEGKYLFHKNLYIGIQLFHNNYVKTNEETIWRYNRAFTQDFELEKHVMVTGGHLKFGVQVHNSKSPLYFDFYAGLGARTRKIEIDNLPNDAEIVEDIEWFGPMFFNFDNDVIGTRTTPSITLGLSIGWQFGK